MYPAVTPIVLEYACRMFSAGLLLCAMVFSAHSVAGSFSVNPVRIELSGTEPHAVIHVENTGPAPVTVQLSTMTWSQADGKDQLRPTRELLATPQIFSLKVGAIQVVRVGTMRKPDSDKELPYRLLLEEIPLPPPADFKGLQVALRVSIPVFLKPPKETKEKLEVTLALRSDRQLTLSAANAGTASAHWSGFSLHDADAPDRVLASYPGAVYVLPGQRREVSVAAPGVEAGKKVLIRAATRGRPVEFHVAPVAP